MKSSTYTIDDKVLEEFNELCKKEGFNKSKTIEKLMIKFIKDKSE